MILNEFSKYLHENKTEIIQSKITCIKLLGRWIKGVLQKKPKTNVEKILHQEITLAQNELEDFLLVAKSPSGQKLTNALYNYALSFEQHVLRQWLEDKKPEDFTK